MCIEAYVDGKTEILFAHEHVQFSGPTTFVGTYTMLIRNTSAVDSITEIHMLYPRPLLSLDSSGNPVLKGVLDLSPRVIEEARSGADKSKKMVGDEFHWKVVNPNFPQQDLQFTGRLEPNAIKFRANLDRQKIELLNELRLTAWTVQLENPLPPLANQWITLAIHVPIAGVEIPGGKLGPLVYHQLASPATVRHTVEEAIHSGKETIFDDNGEATGAELVEHYREISRAFNLDVKRNVDIKYYQLTV